MPRIELKKLEGCAGLETGDTGFFREMIVCLTSLPAGRRGSGTGEDAGGGRWSGRRLRRWSDGGSPQEAWGGGECYGMAFPECALQMSGAEHRGGVQVWGLERGGSKVK